MHGAAPVNENCIRMSRLLSIAVAVLATVASACSREATIDLNRLDARKLAEGFALSPDRLAVESAKDWQGFTLAGGPSLSLYLAAGGHSVVLTDFEDSTYLDVINAAAKHFDPNARNLADEHAAERSRTILHRAFGETGDEILDWALAVARKFDPTRPGERTESKAFGGLSAKVVRIDPFTKKGELFPAAADLTISDCVPLK